MLSGTRSARAVASYVGSVCWLYEKPSVGKVALFLAAVRHWQGWFNSFQCDLRIEIVQKLPKSCMLRDIWLRIRAYVAEAARMGLISGYSRLGFDHYLRPPPGHDDGRDAAGPLVSQLADDGTWPRCDDSSWRWVSQWRCRRLSRRSACGASSTYANRVTTQWWLFLLLRWSFGLVGVAVLAWMAWQTLKIPNTQSATGILYVAVIGTFVGETMALLLSAESLFPL